MADLQPQYIRTYRRTASLSQRELAALVGSVDRTMVSRLEAGERLPPVDVAFALAVALGTTVEALYRGTFSSVDAEVRERAMELLQELSGASGADRVKRAHLTALSEADDPIIVPSWEE